jgi:lipopolysaccharide transport system ATP-binding protein
VVDEVLAVGDADFQKKCLGKMEDVAKEGRTVLFVSHNMASIKQLCPNSILLTEGKIAYQGNTNAVVNFYLGTQRLIEKTAIAAEDIKLRSGTGEGRITRIDLFDENNISSNIFGIGKPLTVRYTLSIPLGSPSIVVGLEIRQKNGSPLVDIRSDSQGIYFEPESDKTTMVVELKILGLPLYPGIYMIEPWFCFKFGRRADQWHEQIYINLEAQGVYKSEFFFFPDRGLIFSDCSWKNGSSQNEIDRGGNDL